jgi:hypothetical protein
MTKPANLAKKLPIKWISTAMRHIMHARSAAVGEEQSHNGVIDGGSPRRIFTRQHSRETGCVSPVRRRKRFPYNTCFALQSLDWRITKLEDLLWQLLFVNAVTNQVSVPTIFTRLPGGMRTTIWV